MTTPAMNAPGMDTPNELMVVFSDAVTAGFNALAGPVNSVLGLMIALVVALTGIRWVLSPDRDLMAMGFGKVLLIGAFAYLINDWQSLSETFYAGFIEMGLAAGGGGLDRADFLNPGAVLNEGWRIVKALGETPAPVDNPLDVVGNLVDALILSLAMIGIMLAFAVLALQIIVALLEFKIVTLGGFVLLPFGVWSRSAFLAERPLGYVVSAGLKILALAIVVSGARTVFAQLQPSANPDLYEALAILVASLLLAMLAIFIPNLAGALVTGGPTLGAGAAVAGGMAAGGAGFAAAAAPVAAGSLAGRAAAISGSARAASSALSVPPPGPPPHGGAASSWRPGPGSGSSPNPGSGSGPRSGPRPGPHLGPGDAPGAPRGTPASPVPARPQQAPGRFPSSDGTTPRRSAAMQTYLAANSARSLLPANETSGSLAPHLKPGKD